MLKKFLILTVLAVFFVGFSGCGKKPVHVLWFSTQGIGADEWVATELNETYLSGVEVGIDSYSQPFVSLKFNDEGAKLFEKLTEEHISKPLGIFVKGKLISAPVINSKISGGVARIMGNFTKEEAEKLAKDINGGI